MDATRIDELDTPCLVVDLDVFESNVSLLMERLAGVRVRPHLKTAKSPAVAKLLLEAGAIGICVAKLGEAEVMLEAGLDDLLITTELIGPVKVRRLQRLREQWPDANLRVVVDSWAGAQALDAALKDPIETLIDVNVAHNRCGVAPEEARPLADRIRDLPQLKLIGLQGYEGNLQHIRDREERRGLCAGAMDRLAQAAADLRAGGHTVDVVTTGGTGTAEFCIENEAVTEVQPGSFAFMDVDYLETGGLPYKSALVAIATVISHATPDRAIIDAGLKTLSDDSGQARLVDALGWSYHNAGDEHGTLTLTTSAARRELSIGDRVTLVPSHIDTTINLHDVIYAQRNGRVEQEWAVAARGKVR